MGCSADIFEAEEVSTDCAMDHDDTFHRSYIVKVAEWYSWPQEPPEVTALQQLRGFPNIVQMVTWDSKISTIGDTTSKFYAIVMERAYQGAAPSTLDQVAIYASLLMQVDV